MKKLDWFSKPVAWQLSSWMSWTRMKMMWELAKRYMRIVREKNVLSMGLEVLDDLFVWK